jgi:putative membrane protein
VNAHDAHSSAALDLGLFGLAGVGLAVVIYVAAAAAENRRGKRHWPAHRTALWLAGLASVAVTLVGPLAERSHDEFPAHMLAHLLVGMLAPILLVLAAPVTLALRTLDVVPARRLSRMLASGPVRLLTHPIPAATINVGSLWLLYTTPLSGAMQENLLLHYILLAHFLVAGYLFTASIIGVDPSPHRAGFRVRLVVLLLMIAGHSILAKYVYANPPEGASVPAAEAGGVLMYYGGDLVELMLITVFFAQWYQRTSARTVDKREPLRAAPGRIR